MSKITTFENHAPINFGGAETVAEYSTDGGVYNRIGHFFVRIEHGKMFHVWQSHNSGCDYGQGTHTTRKYLFGCRTRDELIAWLLKQLKALEGKTEYGFPVRPGRFDAPTWANDLLVELEYEGEEA